MITLPALASGQQMQATVPSGVGPGMPFIVELPAAAPGRPVVAAVTAVPIDTHVV